MAERIRRKDFDQICRLCLVYASDKTDLFPLYISEANIPGFYGRFLKEFKESLPEVITACIGIEIDPSEKLPLRICSNCERQLIVSNQFRQTCLQSNEYLIKLLKTDEIDDFDTDDDVPPNSLEYPELIIVDKIKDEFKEEQMETDSSCDSVWVDNLSDNLQTETNVQDKIDDDEKPVLLSTDKDVIKKSATKRTKTIPLITPSTPIVPVDCNNSEKSQSNIDVPKSTVKYHYPKKQKMCTVCGIIVDRLRDHMRTHPDALEHKCTLCSKKYLTTKGLTKHIRHKHTEDRNLHNPTLAELRTLETIKKYRGESYMSRDGVARSGKCMGPPCKQCIYKCSVHISTEERTQLFNNYYNLASIQKQWQYIARCMHRGSPKQQNPSQKRCRLSIEYYFQLNHGRIRVCKTFFVHTLGISNTAIKTALRKCNLKGELIVGDRRGKYNKIPA
ncbi:uncharacterized protein LOC119066576 isoform X3 [Bradysia coprophila]|uniref:uncharacterized protein LOC119066576 isoform X3 n=1 Tax=Bradysia coprophila TaxID=38358 RepID=UPI00187DB92B|nr:uncharacterized protein LOC119066576 isoform X3 [Bradysia coprophila]